jgi:tetratricopeptide (TPR) repeat protein
VRDGLAQAAPRDADAETWTALARVCFIWGDVRATTPEQKLAAYEQGKDAARRAIELAPRSAMAHLFYGINLGRWGQTRGVLRSLFLLPEMRETTRQTLELDPRLPAAYALAGNVDYEVPGFLGGSLESAERSFRKGLEVDPHFTPLRVGLAKVLRKQGRTAEARKELQAVLDETAPANPAEWSMQDAPEARTLLQAIGP